jgi:hypothetical protein
MANLAHKTIFRALGPTGAVVLPAMSVVGCAARVVSSRMSSSRRFSSRQQIDIPMTHLCHPAEIPSQMTLLRLLTELVDRTRAITLQTLLLAFAVLELTVTPALAGGPNPYVTAADCSYEFPNYWAELPPQYTTAVPMLIHSSIGNIGTYATKTCHGTFLFPPNPNQ